MPTSRLIAFLLAALALVCGIGLPSTAVLCRGSDHVEVESVVAGLHCDDGVADVEQHADREIGEAACVDLPLERAATHRVVSGDVVPSPLPPVLIAVLPADPPMSAADVQAEGVAITPSPHLLSIRSCVLLT